MSNYKHESNKIIAVSGSQGVGKSSLVDKFINSINGAVSRYNSTSYNEDGPLPNWRKVSVGSLMRAMATERGLSLEQLAKLAKTDPSIDRELDDLQRSLTGDDCVVIDSRLGFYFVPGAIKVLLTVSEDEAAGRIYRDVLAGKRVGEFESSVSLAEIKIGNQERANRDRARYLQYYNIDIEKVSNYDLVIDTTQKSANEVFLDLMICVMKKFPEYSSELVF